MTSHPWFRQRRLSRAQSWLGVWFALIGASACLLPSVSLESEAKGPAHAPTDSAVATMKAQAATQGDASTGAPAATGPGVSTEAPSNGTGADASGSASFGMASSSSSETTEEAQAACDTNHGGCDARVLCSDSPTGATCSACPAGYADQAGDGRRCEDLEPCNLNNGGCQLGSSRFDMGIAVGTDDDANVYVLGHTNGDFDGSASTNDGSNDLFVVNFDAQGRKVWSRQFGEKGANDGLQLLVSGSGQHLVLSRWGDQGATGDAKDGGQQLAKFSPTGSLLWSKSEQSSELQRVAVNASEEIYAIGTMRETPSTPSTALMIKYNAQGDELWRRDLNTPGHLRDLRLAFDSKGRLLVSVYLGEVDLHHSSSISQYDADGQSVWTLTLACRVESMVVDSDDNVFAVGSRPHAFLAKLSAAGTALWEKETSPTFNGVTSDRKGNVYAFDTRSSDLTIVKLNAAGDELWSQRFGTNDRDFFCDVAALPAGGVLVTGGTDGVVDGDAVNGQADMFLVRYDADGRRL